MTYLAEPWWKQPRLAKIGQDAIMIDYALSTTKIIIVKYFDMFEILICCWNLYGSSRLTLNDYEWPRMTTKNGIIANPD